MNRIDTAFATCKQANKKAFIAFLTAGDPDYATTEATVLEMERQGVDLIELGVPFSDPVAEGPVIQKSSLRSLEHGTTLKGIFEMVKRLRERTQIPLLLMMYINTIFRFGKERFFALCAETGIDGVIVPDLPYEEFDEIAGLAKQYGIYNIHLVAPTSHQRIASIAKDSEGFLYCVSSTGVTGMRQQFSTDFAPFFSAIREASSTPCALGFGISTPEQAREMKQYCDGVIIGSAIVQIMEQEKQQAPKAVGAFAQSIRKALDEIE